MTSTRGAFCSLLLLLQLCLTSIAAAEDSHKIGSRRELFVDGALIDRLVGNAERRLHSPVPREIALRFDQPWEGNTSG